MTENLPNVITFLYVTVKRKIQILLLQIREVGPLHLVRDLHCQSKHDLILCGVS